MNRFVLVVGGALLTAGTASAGAGGAEDFTPRVCFPPSALKGAHSPDAQPFDIENPSHFDVVEALAKAGGKHGQCALGRVYANPESRWYDPGKARRWLEADATWLCPFRAAHLARLYDTPGTGFSNPETADQWRRALAAYRAVDDAIDHVRGEAMVEERRAFIKFHDEELDSQEVRSHLRQLSNEFDNSTPETLHGEGRKLAFGGPGPLRQLGGRYLYAAMRRGHRQAAVDYAKLAYSCKIATTPLKFGHIDDAMKPFADKGDAEALLWLARSRVYGEVWRKGSQAHASRRLDEAERAGADVRADRRALERRAARRNAQ